MLLKDKAKLNAIADPTENTLKIELIQYAWCWERRPLSEGLVSLVDSGQSDILSGCRRFQSG